MSVINCDRSGDASAAYARTTIGILSEQKLEQLDDALRFALGLET